VLRRASDGTVVLELEHADISRLLATGWRRPEPFAARARDGATDVYGLIWWPSTFDSTTPYPVVEQIYTGPHGFFVPKSFGAYRNTAQTIAELGFVVVQVDGLGTNHRGTAFRLRSWKNLGDGGLEDHIAALRQLAQTRPYLDLTRVGIYGHSAGGYDAAHAMLTHPSSTRWPSRPRGITIIAWTRPSGTRSGWGGRGRPLPCPVERDTRVQPPGQAAAGPRGRGRERPVSATLQLVNALIEANKDFDLLILPNQTHNLGRHAYLQRRRWDFFVEHLLGIEPPAGYRITAFDAPAAEPVTRR